MTEATSGDHMISTLRVFIVIVIIFIIVKFVFKSLSNHSRSKHHLVDSNNPSDYFYLLLFHYYNSLSDVVNCCWEPNIGHVVTQEKLEISISQCDLLESGSF